MRFKQYILLGLPLFLLACYSSSKLSQTDYTYLYDPDQKLISPQVKIFHSSADSSELYFRIRQRDVLYGKLMNDSDLTTRVLMRYKLYENASKGKLVDSSTLAFIDHGYQENVEFLGGKTKLYMPVGKLYKMRLYFRDEYKDLNTVYEYIFDKRPNGNQEFYLLKQEGQVLINTIAINDRKIKVFKSPLIRNVDYLSDSLNYDFKMTPPPFIENVSNEQIKFQRREEYQLIDSIEIQSLGNVNRLIPKDSSLLRFHYFYLGEDFPYLTKVSELVDPIRYISTTSEFKKVKNAVNQKGELDAFWLKIGKDESTAKQLIKEYYSRVEIANMSFSSFKEGWKTDRGIIFIVYGQPTKIEKEAEKEVWTYGEENNILSVKFTFRKLRSEESNNIYVLERNEDYKSNWYRAVDEWRQGRIGN